MSSTNPLLSIVVATHDRSTQLAGLVGILGDQVDEQTEVVVVDDGSSDDTAAELGGLAVDRPWLRWSSTPNGRLSRARNAGASMARGDWLLFLDDDDRPLPGWAEAFRSVVAGSPDLVLVTAGLRYVTQDGQVTRERLPEPMGPAFDQVHGPFMAGVVAVRATTFHAVGGFRPDQPTSHMTELALRLVGTITDPDRSTAHIDRPLADIVQADSAARGRNDPERLLAGTTHILEAHRQRIDRDPKLLADFAGVAGVAAVRAGRLREARRWFGTAARARPRPVTLGRLVVSRVPPLATRAWS